MKSKDAQSAVIPSLSLILNDFDSKIAIRTSIFELIGMHQDRTCSLRTYSAPGKRSTASKQLPEAIYGRFDTVVFNKFDDF